MVWDLDVCYSKGHRLSYNTFTKVQTQDSQDFSYLKKFKRKDSKLTSSCDNLAKLPKKNDRKDKKKRFQGQIREHTREQKEQIPVTNVNTTYILKKKKKKRDIGEIIYFNCNKKSHFASNCTKPKN